MQAEKVAYAESLLELLVQEAPQRYEVVGGRQRLSTAYKQFTLEAVYWLSTCAVPSGAAMVSRHLEVQPQQWRTWGEQVPTTRNEYVPEYYSIRLEEWEG